MADKCVVDSLGGNNHPYRYCIKPLNQMIDGDRINDKSRGFNMVGVSQSIGALTNYTTALVGDPSNSIADECKGILGNRYLLKTGVKCSNGEYVHKYINNVEDYNPIVGRVGGKLGIIPAALNSAMRINVGGLVDALTGDAYPKCKRVKVPCHVVDETDDSNSYSGPSNWVHITEDDFNKLRDKRILHSDGTINEKSDIDLGYTPNENFENLYESINSYLKQHPYLSKVNAEDPLHLKYKKISAFNDDPLVNIYYILLSLFLLYLVFKIINKK